MGDGVRDIGAFLGGGLLPGLAGGAKVPSLAAETNVIESGGGAATPFSEDFLQMLSSILFGGGGGGGRNLGPFGGRGAPSPVGRTQGIASVIQNLIGGADITGQGKALESIIQSDIGRNVADLRERFTASGAGVSVGTPGAVAESQFRAEAVPRKALALGELEFRNRASQLAALIPILQIAAGLGGRGIPQARTDITIDDPDFLKWLEVISGFAQGAGSFADSAGGTPLPTG